MELNAEKDNNYKHHFLLTNYLKTFFMKEVDAYKIAWNANSHDGTIILHTIPDGIEQIGVSNPSECMLLVDLLRNEKPIYINNGVLFTGFEEVGEGEVHQGEAVAG